MHQAQTSNITIEKYLENIKLSYNQLNIIWKHLSSISSETGVEIKYSNKNNLITIIGTNDQITTTKDKFYSIISPSQSENDEICCICLESIKKMFKSFGILESCNHVFCYECIMNWRKNKTFSKKVRLGCPSCRTLTHLIIRYDENVSEPEEKRRLFKNYKERCKTIPCKWAARNEPCSAGKHCLYDHSKTPPVKHHYQPRTIIHSELAEILFDDDADFASFLLEGDIYVYSDSDIESIDFSDEELAEAIAALRRTRLNNNSNNARQNITHSSRQSNAMHTRSFDSRENRSRPSNAMHTRSFDSRENRPRPSNAMHTSSSNSMHTRSYDSRENESSSAMHTRSNPSNAMQTRPFNSR
jgi:hypothetical protein